MSEYQARITGLHVTVQGGDIFDEFAFRIEIANDGAGEYIDVKTSGSDSSLKIDRAQWPVLRDAIEKMIAECRE